MDFLKTSGLQLNTQSFPGAISEFIHLPLEAVLYIINSHICCLILPAPTTTPCPPAIRS